MKVASSTPPERMAETFSAVTISKLIADRPPAIPAKNADTTNTKKRTRCGL